MRPCAAPCAIFPSGANGGPKTSAEAQRSGFGGKWRSYILPSGQPDGHTCPQWGQETRPRCPARKLSFLRWGKHSAWLSAPHFAAPGGGFAGRSPHPLPRRKVRFARNALREWAFLALLPCSSFSNGTRFAGLPFERKPEKKRRLAQRKKTENGT